MDAPKTNYDMLAPSPLKANVAAAFRECNELRLRVSVLEAALHQINALNDSPARFNGDIQDVLNAVIDTSDTKF